MGVLSKENVIFGLKVAAVISLGNFAGATGYIQTAVQPALIAQEDATQAAQVRKCDSYLDSYILFYLFTKKGTPYLHYQNDCMLKVGD